MTSLPEIEARHIEIQKAYLLSCTNARLEDFADAANVVKGKRIAEHVEFYIAAASGEIQRQAESAGHWQHLVDAGAIALPPGCGPCIGLGRGTIDAGEVGISATNRNFKGRMGSKDAEVYLGSPSVVAASAIAGYLCAPQQYAATKVIASIERREEPVKESADTEILDGFPAQLSGRALLLAQDNLNTDGIYAGKHTYNDDMSEDEMAQVVFENYDESFGSVFQAGDIIVSGRNFGTGSSREQAATALKYRGIPCVIAVSFSETYKRNAFNNGFAAFECPDLVDHLVGKLGRGNLTIAGSNIEINFRKSVVTCDGADFRFSPLGAVPQELIVSGGAESLIRNRLGS